MNAGHISDDTGSAALLDDLPKAHWLLGDRGYDADWFRDAMGRTLAALQGVVHLACAMIWIR